MSGTGLNAGRGMEVGGGVHVRHRLSGRMGGSRVGQ